MTTTSRRSFAAARGPLSAAFLFLLLLLVAFSHAFQPAVPRRCTGRTSRTFSRGATSLYASTQEQQAASHTTTTTTINPLLSSIKVSKTVEIFSLVKQMQAEGEKVTSLCVGEPDFPPPTVVLEAAKEALSRGETKYTAVTGTLELRQAIAQDLKKRKHISYDPLSQIIVSNGAKQAVYQGILATCGVSDGVLIPAPYWPSYPEMALLCGAEPIIVETKMEDGFLLAPHILREALENHPNAKLLILCNPSNPTGGVHDKKRLEELAEVLLDYPQVVILADEIYERLVYTDNPDDGCTSFASISPDMYERTLLVNGFSKSHAMTGMRLGYVAAPKHLASAITTIQSQLTSCAGSISQAAGVAALLQVSEEEMQRNVEIMKEKRDYVLKRLGEMNHVIMAVPPQGAFYCLPDVSYYMNGDDTTLCLELLKQKKLALVPGSSFGAPGTVRLSYATSMDELKEAMDKLQEFLEEQEQLQKQHER